MPNHTMEAPLVTRAGHVRQQAKRYEELRNLAAEQNAFTQWLQKFRKQAIRLEAINRIRRELSNEGIPLQGVMPSDATQEDLQAFLEEFQQDPSVLIATSRVRHNNALIARLDNHAGDREEKTLQDWQAYVASLKPPVPGEVLDVLGRIPAFRETVRSIRSALSNMERAAERLPQSRDEIVQVRNWAEVVRDQWKTLGGEGIPEEVLSFLRDAGTVGAPLNSLTDSVQSWLQSNNLENSFAIKMRTTPPA